MSPVDAVLRLWLVCYSCTTISQNLRMSLSLSSHHKSPEREHGCSSRLPEAQQVATGKRQRPTPGVDLGSNPSGTSFLRLGKLLLGSWQLTGYATWYSRLHSQISKNYGHGSKRTKRASLLANVVRKFFRFRIPSTCLLTVAGV